MPVSTQKVDIKVTAKSARKAAADIRKTEAAMRKLGVATDRASFASKRMRVSTGGLQRQVGILRNKVLLATFALGGLATMIKKTVDAYRLQFIAETKLRAGLKNVASDLGVSADALIDYAGALQKVTTHADEEIIAGMAMLATFQMNGAAIKALTPRLLSMAEAARSAGLEQFDLKSVAIALGKGFTGQVGILSRYGVMIDQTRLKMARAGGTMEEFNFLLTEMDRNYEDIAEAVGRTQLGLLTQYQMQISDTAEKMGKELLPVQLGWTKLMLKTSKGVRATITAVKSLWEAWKEGGSLTKRQLRAHDIYIDKMKDFKRAMEDLGIPSIPANISAQIKMREIAFKVEEEHLRTKLLLGDGVITQQEQLQFLFLQQEQAQERFYLGMISKQELYLVEEQLANRVLTIYEKQMQASVKWGISIQKTFADAAASAIINGRKMGDALVGALKQVVTQALAAFILLSLIGAISPGALSKMGGFNISTLLQLIGFGSGVQVPTGGAGGKIVGGGNEAIAMGVASAATQTNIEINISGGIINEEFMMTDMLPAIERAVKSR